MSSVLFAHAHVLAFDPKQHAIGKPYPPLATLFAAAHAREGGHDVSLFDPMLDDGIGGFATSLDRSKAEVVVLYDDSFNWFTKMCLSAMSDAAIEMIKEARARNVTVIVAGHDAADHPERYLDHGASFVVVGEGEQTVRDLLDACNASDTANIDLSARAMSIPGLVMRDRGIVRRSPPRTLRTNLDELPLPAWDLVDIDRYRDFWKRRHGYFSLNIVTTRGCPYRCNWCAKPVYGSTYHVRSPENVVREMRLLKDRYAPDHFWFCDDILGLKFRWLIAWSKLVGEHGVRTPFLCQTRADLMLPENVVALARAGAREVWLGAESGSQRILDAMEKGIQVAQTHDAAKRLRAEDVRVGLFIQLGYSGEEWSDIQLTRKMIQSIVPDDIGVSVSYPLPGTSYYERVKSSLGKKQNWKVSTDLDPLVPQRYSKDFYQTLARLIHAELRLRQAMNVTKRRTVRTLPKNLRAVLGVRHAPRWAIERVRLQRILNRDPIETR